MSEPRLTWAAACCALLMALASGCGSVGVSGGGDTGGVGETGADGAGGDPSGDAATGASPDATVDGEGEGALTDGGAGAPDGSVAGPDVDRGDPADGVEAPQAGAFGSPCADGGDCFSGYCLPTAAGMRCTSTCDDVCPTGFQCVFYGAGGPDPTHLCVDHDIDLCSPCLDVSDCSTLLAGQSNLCLQAADPSDGSFCGRRCEEGDPACPSGFECVVIDGVEPGQDQQCVPADAAVCECSPWATEIQAATTCEVVNPHGACPGTRGCAGSGLGECVGPAPQLEVCDGVDDDCDGLTDEGIVSGPCTVGGPNGCPGATACQGGQEICVGDAPTTPKTKSSGM